MRTWLWLLALVAAQSVADPSPISRSFQVQAFVVNGCVFGSSGNSVSDLGTIDFGTVTNLSLGQSASSTAGNGSIVLTCTPGMTLNVGLGSGLNSVSTSERYLKHVSGTELLAYQLYRDAAHMTVWGTGAQALSIANFSVATQTYVVYARLLPRTGLPSAGEYRDTVVVELLY